MTDVPGRGGWSDGLRLAVGTLTVIPSGPVEVSPASARAAMLLAPAATLPLAVAAGGATATPSLGVPPSIAAVLVLVVLAVGSRALHLDGLADTVDALGGGWTRERALTILRSGDVGPMGVVALVLVLFGVPGHPATGFAHLTDHGGFMPGGMESIWLSMSIVMFAFVGVEVVPITAAEADDPRRSVRTAMRALVARLGLFYVIAVGLIVTLNAWTDVASAKGLTASPFVKAFDAVGLPAAAGIMNAVILVAALSTGNAQLYGAGRLVHSLAVDRLAPRFLARTTLRGVPLAATLVSTFGLVLAIYLAQTGVADIFTKLASIAIFSVMVTWLLALASFIAFKRRGDVDGSVHLPGGSVTAALGVVGVLAVMATAFEVDDMRQAALIGSGWVLVLLVAYLLTRAGRARARTY